MRRIFAAVLALALLLCGCSGDGPAETEPVRPMTTSAATTAKTEPQDEGSAVHSLSTELYSDGESVIFADPATGYLIKYDLASGESKKLCYEKADPAFIVVGHRVYFRSSGTGQICAVRTDGTEFKTYFSMPFSEGVYIDGLLWFAAENTSSGEYLLYSYDPAQSEWSSTMLSGSIATDNRRTIVYTEDAVFFIARDNGLESVVMIDPISGERTSVYVAAERGSGVITELVEYDGKVCFVDGSLGRLLVVDRAGNCARYSDATVGRLVAPLADGMLYVGSKSWQDTVTIGNAEGTETECFGGVFLARCGNRALVWRSEGVCVVKYPEDAVELTVSGYPVCVRRGESYALVAMENDPSYRLISFNSDEVILIDGAALSRKTVSPEEYVLSPENALPDAEAVAAASPAVKVGVFAAAASAGDADVINMLLEGALNVIPYNGFHAESFEITCSLLTDSEAEYEIAYSFADVADGAYIDFVPIPVGETVLRLENVGGRWKFVWPEPLAIVNDVE